jgi:hypothetical protein
MRHCRDAAALLCLCLAAGTMPTGAATFAASVVRVKQETAKLTSPCCSNTAASPP